MGTSLTNLVDAGHDDLLGSIACLIVDAELMLHQGPRFICRGPPRLVWFGPGARALSSHLVGRRPFPLVY